MKQLDSPAPVPRGSSVVAGLSALMGASFVLLSLLFGYLFFVDGKISWDVALFFGGLLLVGLGLLQFAYLLHSKRPSRISNGVIYLGAMSFMIMASAVLWESAGAPRENQMRVVSAGIGMFVIGLLALNFARTRKRG